MEHGKDGIFKGRFKVLKETLFFFEFDKSLCLVILRKRQLLLDKNTKSALTKKE